MVHATINHGLNVTSLINCLALIYLASSVQAIASASVAISTSHFLVVLASKELSIFPLQSNLRALPAFHCVVVKIVVSLKSISKSNLSSPHALVIVLLIQSHAVSFVSRYHAVVSATLTFDFSSTHDAAASVDSDTSD